MYVIYIYMYVYICIYVCVCVCVSTAKFVFQRIRSLKPGRNSLLFTKDSISCKST